MGVLGRSFPRRLVLLGLLAGVLGAGPAWAQHAHGSDAAEGGAAEEHGHGAEHAEAEPANEWCPVLTDEPVDPEIHTTYRGTEVYLCCRKCLKRFTADPEAYVANLPGWSAGAGEQAAPHAEESEAQEHDEAPHDHSDHGAGADGGGATLLEWLGRLHPMVVHFPIALLLLAALAELFAARFPGTPFGFAARFCLWGGALTALVAVLLGWINASSGGADAAGEYARLLVYHRWGGVSTAAVATLALFACERAARSTGGRWKRLYRGVLFLGAALVAVTGHLGASLIYGWDYLAW